MYTITNGVACDLSPDGEPVRGAGLGACDFPILIIGEKKRGFRSTAVDPEIRHPAITLLPGPAWRTAGAAEFVFKIGEFFLAAVQFFSGGGLLLLSLGDLLPDIHFPVV